MRGLGGRSLSDVAISCNANIAGRTGVRRPNVRGDCARVSDSYDCREVTMRGRTWKSILRNCIIDFWRASV